MSANPQSPIPPIGPTTGMTPPPGQARFKPIDPLRVLRQHLWLLIAAAVGGAIIGTAVWGACRLWAPSYRSAAQLQLQRSANLMGKDINRFRSMGRTDVIEYLIRTQMAQIQVEPLLRRVLNRDVVRGTVWFQQFVNKQGVPRLDEAMRSLQEDHLSVGMTPQSLLFTVSVQTEQKEDAAEILDAVLDVYFQHLRMESQTTGTQAGRALQNELSRLEREISQIQQQQADFVQRYDIESLRASKSSTSARHMELSTQRVMLQVSLAQAKQTLKTMRQQQQSGRTQRGPEDMIVVQQNPRIQTIDQTLDRMRTQYQAMLVQFGPRHNTARNLQNQIEAKEAERERIVDQLVRQRQQAQIEQAAKRLEAIKAQLADIDKKMATSSARMTDLTAKLTRYKSMSNNLERKMDRQAEVDDALRRRRLAKEGPFAVPVKLASGSTRPELAFPTSYIMIPGVTLLVFGLVTGGVFLRELMDQRLKSPADVKLIPEAELLGTIPDAAEDPTGEGRIEGAVARDSGGLLAEALRNIRTEVLMKMDRRGYRTLVMTGPYAQAGTSSVTHNLAISMAHNGRRVLILDANLRRPVQHRLSDVPGRTGLADVVLGRANLEQAVQAAPETEHLWVLPTGDAHDVPPELFDRAEFRAVLSQLEADYDLVLIDAPPALLTSDAQLLAKHVDAMALVARGGRDTHGMVGRMMRRLDGQRADLLGLILSSVRSSSGGYFRKSYREFHRYRQNGDGVSNGKAAPSERSTPAQT